MTGKREEGRDGQISDSSEMCELRGSAKLLISHLVEPLIASSSSYTPSSRPTMNPQDLHLLQQPVASTSQLTRSASASSQPPPASTSASTSAPDPSKSKKEQKQEQRDLELSQLLEQMDEYNPIASLSLAPPLSPSLVANFPVPVLQIPDEVTDYYLQRSGFDTNDVRVSVLSSVCALRFACSLPPRFPSCVPFSKRLLGLAAQKFISSISQDAFQYARARTGGNSSKNASAAAGGQGSTTAKVSHPFALFTFR